MHSIFSHEYWLFHLYPMCLEYAPNNPPIHLYPVPTWVLNHHPSKDVVKDFCLNGPMLFKSPKGEILELLLGQGWEWGSPNCSKTTVSNSRSTWLRDIQLNWMFDKFGKYLKCENPAPLEHGEQWTYGPSTICNVSGGKVSGIYGILLPSSRAVMKMT